MKNKLILVLLALFLALLGGPQPAAAQSFNAHDLIGTVNDLRAGLGLAAYDIDGDLMAKAQEHSEYQASIGTITHTHSDGGSPASHGVQENIAGGSAAAMSVSYVVNQIWADALHMNTMAGYASGRVGAGVAVAGDTMYITLEVRPGAAVAVKQSAPVNEVQAAPGQQAQQALPVLQATASPQNSVVTVTPQPDGSIVHTVRPGEALWSIAIAYGVTIAEIRSLNGMGAEANDIYEGQDLLIRQGNPALLTPSATATFTAEPTRQATRTPTLRPTATPAEAIPAESQPASTARPTATQAEESSRPGLGLNLSGTRLIGVILIAISLIGILVLVLTAFRK